MNGACRARPCIRHLIWLVSCGALLLVSLVACGSAAPADPFRIVVLADPHIIDEFFEQSDDTDENDVSLHYTNERLQEACRTVNRLSPAPAAVFVAGDIMHNYPSTEYNFFFEHTTRIDIARETFATLTMPVYHVLGNHDYSFSDFPMEQTHQLFKAKLGIDPYSAVELNGYLFLMLNTFLGESDFATNHMSLGSLGQEQLAWLEGQLQRGLPTFIVMHYPLFLLKPQEAVTTNLVDLLYTYQDQIHLLIAGHTHGWWDFSDQRIPTHYTIASTRFDPQNMLIIDIDPGSDSYTLANADRLCWMTQFTRGSRADENCQKRPE